MNVLYVLIGGGFGAVLRYTVQLGIGKGDGNTFPMSTFLVNIIGSLLVGILAAIALKYKWNEMLVLFVFTGFLGGFTTFSSFALEFFQLMKNNHAGLAFLYLGLSNFVGLALCAIGYQIAK